MLGKLNVVDVVDVKTGIELKVREKFSLEYTYLCSDINPQVLYSNIVNTPEFMK